MKNAMKKLMSVLLVAVLLVSAIPFQASAATGDGFYYVIQEHTADDTYVSTLGSGQWREDDEGNPKTKTATDILNYWNSSWANTYTFLNAYGDIDANGTAKTVTNANTTFYSVNGQTVYIHLVRNSYYNATVYYRQTGATSSFGTATFKNVQSVSLTDIANNIPASTDSSITYSLNYAVIQNTSTQITGTYTLSGDVSIIAYVDVNSTSSGSSGSSSSGTVSSSSTGTVSLTVNVDGNTYTQDVSVSTSAKLTTILAAWNSDWATTYADYTYSAVSAQQGTVYTSTVIYAGDSVTVTMTAPSSSSSSSSTTTTNKFPYNVYLRVYMNNDVDTVNRTLDISNGIALDGIVTIAEVRSLLLNYYTANDDNGIQIDGMYLATGNWVANFVNDTEKYDTITGIDEMRANNTVFINVMLTNATASSSSSSTADSTNPKTGDTIMAPVAMLGLSAAALAVFFLNKKRLAL